MLLKELKIPPNNCQLTLLVLVMMLHYSNDNLQDGNDDLQHSESADLIKINHGNDHKSTDIENDSNLYRCNMFLDLYFPFILKLPLMETKILAISSKYLHLLWNTYLYRNSIYP